MSFSQIPDTLRVPGVFVEVDPTVASTGPGVFPFRCLIIGQKTASGTVAALTPRRTTRISQAREEHGPGSLSARLAKAWLEANSIVELDVVSIEDGGAVKATSTLTIGGTIATPGTIYVYVCGTRYAVLAQTDVTVTAAAIVAAVTADTDSPVTAGNVAGVITFTAKNGGEFGLDYDLRTNHLDGEDLPGSLTAVATAWIDGASNPDISTTFAGIAGTRYDVILHAYVDTTNLNLLKTEMEARADALQGDPGVSFSGLTGTQSALAALGNVRNDKFACFVGMESFPGVGAYRAAAVAGQAGRFLQDDPVRPVTDRKSIAGFGPSPTDRFTPAERDLLLHDGVSTIHYDRSNVASVERLITTYQETAGGSPDEAFLDVQTSFGLSFVRRSYAAHFATQFPNHKLADNGTPTPAGTTIVTPDIAKADAVAWYGGLVAEGICEDLPGFITNTTVNRHSSDPNRLELFLAVNLVNQLRVTAALLQFTR